MDAQRATRTPSKSFCVSLQEKDRIAMAYIVTHDVINEQGFMKLLCFKLPRVIVHLVADATSFAYNSVKSRLIHDHITFAHIAKVE
jgi:hypothetical protein